MKTIQYTITATDGLHARPAGLLAKCAQELDSEIIITCGGKSANAKKLFFDYGFERKGRGHH